MPTTVSVTKIVWMRCGYCKKLLALHPDMMGTAATFLKKRLPEKLAAGIPYVIRQKMPTEGTTSFQDEVYGLITVDNDTLDDQVLIKADGMPTYNFANVVDDHTMGITHVIRGSEYLSSTPKYTCCIEAFGWEIPTYIHCPPVMKNATEKLSKRNGARILSGFMSPKDICLLQSSITLLC